MRILLAALLVPILANTALAQTEVTQVATQAKLILARLDGEIKAPGLKEPVEVLRDKWGVPHIYAKNADDLFFAQGYVAAQDRLFQLDLWRRLAVGELAEILGPEAIEADTFARLLRYRGDMNAEWSSYSPDTKEIATAFTNGINACIKDSSKRLPIEFQILGYEPSPWRPEDILGRMSGIIMSRNFNDEVVRASLIDKLGLEKVRLLMPTDPVRDFAPDKALDLKGIDARILKGYQAATKVLNFKPAKTESNNWVIAGTMSASGKPMLASDPHRAIALPALRYLVHLNAPGWNVIGAGEPALPGVALGHNENIAWGITIVGTDQADIFVHEPTGAKNDPWVVVTEQIRVKGKIGLTSIELRFIHGQPVLFHDDKTQRTYSLKWSGSEPGGAAYLGGLAVSRAKNKAEFLKALEAYKIPALNFVYADVEGNIGWVANGLTPIRAHDGLLPVPGNGAFAWKGYLAVKDLPQSFNPKSGFLATANHKIIPPDYKHQISYEFAPSYRFDRVKARLEGKDKLTLADFQRIQHDDVSIPGQKLARFAKGLAFNNPEYHDRARIMEKWDGRLSLDTHAGLVYAHWLIELQKEVYGRHVPADLIKELASKSGLPTMFHALENPTEAWFGKDPESARDQIIQRSFVAAVGTILKGGLKAEASNWGAVHTVTFRHPIGSHSKLFNIGPYERTGDGNTPNNTRYDDKFQQIHGATYRHVLDLADWDKGMATSAPGQSGQYGSPHYADLAPLWARGEYFPLAYSRKKVEDVTAHKLLLQP